jgi:hypothetical protein
VVIRQFEISSSSRQAIGANTYSLNRVMKKLMLCLRYLNQPDKGTQLRDEADGSSSFLLLKSRWIC